MKPHPRSVLQAKILADHLNALAASGYTSGIMDSRRLDADETNMLALALEQMRTRVYETEYPELKARKFLPVAGDIDPGADTFAWEETDEVGSVKVIEDGKYTEDLPSVETSSVKVTNGVISLGLAYEWSIQDVRRAAFSGRPLESRKAVTARRIYERGLDAIAAVGASSDGIATGAVNRPFGSSAGQTRNTAMTAAYWDSTPDAAGMVADACKAVQEMIADSKELWEPDTLLLPTLQYLRMSQTWMTDGSPESALDRFLKSNGFVKQVFPWNKLKEVDGTGGNNSRGLLYQKSAEVLELVIPQEFEVMAPQARNLGFVVPAFGRVAGCVVYRPLGMRYLSGLPDS